MNVMNGINEPEIDRASQDKIGQDKNHELTVGRIRNNLIRDNSTSHDK